MFIFQRKGSRLGRFASASFHVGMVILMLLTACGPANPTNEPGEVAPGEEPAGVATPLPLEPQYYDAPEISAPERTSPEADVLAVELPPERAVAPVEFIITASPALVNIGEEVTFSVSVRNQSGEAVTGLVYTDLIERGLLVVSLASGGKYDNGTVSYAFGDLPDGGEKTFSYVLKVTSRNSSYQGGELWLHQVALSDGKGDVDLTAQALIGVGTGLDDEETTLAVVQEEGGWVPVGEVAVYLPPEAVAQDGLLVLTEQASGEGDPEMKFELSVIETGDIATDQNGDPQEQRLAVTEEAGGEFNAPVFLQVNFDQVSSLEEIPAGQEPFIATYYAEYDIWVKVPILDVDYANNTAMVQTTHFSTWGAGLGASLPQNGTGALLFDQPYTSLFTGAAQYSIPVWMPPGRAGLSPNVTLSYSSGTVNGVLGDVQAPWVGEGWNIDSAEIVRKITTSSTGYGYTNSFALAINGALYEMIRDEFQPARYYVKQNAFLYIELHNYALQNEKNPSNQVPNNISGEWWEVVMTDGTRYRFGWNQDSEQLALMYGYACTQGGDRCISPSGPYASSGYAGKYPNLVTRRWRVDRVTDIHGNFITYTYNETQLPTNSTVPAYDRSSYLSTISYTGYDTVGEENDLLPGYQIRFKLTNRSDIGDVPTTYNVWDLVDEQYLDKIWICRNPCQDEGINSIRTYDLGYTLAAAPNTNGTLTLTRLAISGGGFSENGVSIPTTQSATVRFTYENKSNRASGAGDQFNYPRLVKIENGYGGQLTYTYETDNRANDSWYNYRVQKVDVEGGLGLAARRSYAYVTPVYTGEGSNPNKGELIGYTTVTEKVLDYLNADALLMETRHQFGTSGLDVGREYWTEVSDGTTVWQKTVNTYVTDNSAAPSPVWNYRYLAQTESYVRSSGSLNLVSKATYYRDPATGNLLVQSDYLGASLYRKTYYEYLVNSNPAVHIFDTVSRALLVDAGNQIFSDTRYHYDGGINTLPTHGDLTLTQVRTGSGIQTVDSTAIYDEYGNILESRRYESFGSMNTAPSGTYQGSSVVYDTTVYTYPLSATNPLGETSDTNYFFNLGLAFESTDPNGWKTTTIYDGLGRTLSVTPPGLGYAGVTYSYPAPDPAGRVAAPYAIEMQILDQPASVYRSVWGIYDGLGRILQNQVFDQDRATADKLLVTEVAFNPRGLIEKQSLPHYVLGNGGSYFNPAWTSPNTSFVYDNLGRQKSVTAPGPIVTSTAYDGLSVTQTDPNGNKRIQVSDGLGRMLQVQEFMGSSLYATTQYKYDEANRLKQVTDALLNTTTITYNWLGQKTSMDDPDMGAWAYTYNPLGTLASQADARSQILTFVYDDLNRLVEKRDSSNILASYTYGATIGTRGMRTSMTSYENGLLSSTSQWTYSNFSRTITEQKTIGNETHQMTTEADWLGRVLSVTYPDGEVLTYQYDELGRPDSLTSSASPAMPLAELVYDQLGRISSTALGNGVDVTNTYDSALRLLTRTAGNDASQTLLEYTYTYDNNGNITEISDQVLDEVISYEYDGLNRLVTALAESGLAPGGPDIYSQDFTFDKIGNLLLVNGAGAAASLFGEQDGSPLSLAPLFDSGSNRRMRASSFTNVATHSDLEDSSSTSTTNSTSDIKTGLTTTPVPTSTPVISPTKTPVYTPPATPASTSVVQSEQVPLSYVSRPVEARTSDRFGLARILSNLTRLFDPRSLDLNLLWPGLGDYLGPNRVVTTSVWQRSTCNYRATKTGGTCYLTLYAAPNNCVAASSTAPYFNNSPSACGTGWGGTCGVNFSCSISLTGNSVGGCSQGQTGCTNSTNTTTYPEATISGTISCSQMGNNGWCVGTSSLSLSANEPVGGYSITSIEGTQNGGAFSCPGSSCDKPLVEGTNNFTYWAHSSWGDTSQQGSSSAKLDSQAPPVSLSWIASTCPLCGPTLNVTMNVTDATSGVSAWNLSLDSTSIASGTSPISQTVPVQTAGLSSGSHTLTLSASDAAGNSNSTDLIFTFDPSLVPAGYTNQPNEVASADTMISSQSPGTNLGSYSLLFVGEETNDTDIRRALLEFNLSSIPANASVTSATLTLTIASDNSDNARDFCIYRLQRDWVEIQATWNSYSSGSAWQTSGAGGTADVESTAIGCLAFSANEAAESQKSWSLDIAAIQAMVSGSWANQGFLIRTSGEENDQYRFYSSASSTEAYWPKLVIEYCLPATPTPTASSTSTATPTASPTPTASSTVTDTPTVTSTYTASATNLYTPSITRTATNTRTPTITRTASNTRTPTITRTPSITRTPTNTRTATYTRTITRTPTNTRTFTKTRTSTWTFTPTRTYTPTLTFTPTSTLTSTITLTPSNTPVTNTPFPTASSTRTPTQNGTSTPSHTRTNTPTFTPTTGLGSGLMGYWNFDNVSGLNVPDDSGLIHPGTLSGAHVYWGGHSGWALAFDGVDDYVSIPYHTDFAPSGSFTIVTWVNPETISTSHVTRLVDRSGVFSLQFDTNGHLQFKVEGLTPNNILGPQLPIDQWALVVAMYDSALQQVRLYVNNESVATLAVTGTKAANTNALYLGSSSSGERYNGELDEVRFYNRVLTGAEMTALYSAATATPAATFTPSATPSETRTPTGPTSTFTVTTTITPTPIRPDQYLWGTGQDGDLTVATATTSNISTQNHAGRTCADGGDAVAYSITQLTTNYVVVSPAPAAGCLLPNDELLLINLQGSSTYYHVGKFEFLRVQSVVGNIVTFTTAEIGWYGAGETDNTNIGIGPGQQRVVIQRVPNYDDVTINGTLTGTAYDGYRYGLMPFRVNGTLSGSGLIKMDVLGYAGGRGCGGGGIEQWNGQSYSSVLGQSGAGLAGPNYDSRYGPTKGAGSGGHSTVGTQGVSGGGAGGQAYGSPDLHRVSMGSGGGGEGCDNGSPGGSGGNGGGAIFIVAQAIDFDGQITAKGAPGGGNRPAGGSGGSIRIDGASIDLNSVSVAGGIGGGAPAPGAAGRVAVYYSTSYSANFTPGFLHYTGSAPTPMPTPTPVAFDPFTYGDGKNGDLTIPTGTTFNIHTQTQSLTFQCADGGDAVTYRLTGLTASSATLSTTPTSGCLNPGDEILLINLHGSVNTGKYEFLRVGSVSGNTVYFIAPKINLYGSNSTDDTNINLDNVRVVIQRVPNYNNVIINGTLTGNPFEMATGQGARYGLIVFRVKGTLSGSGTITATNLGYTGGTGCRGGGAEARNGLSYNWSVGTNGAGVAGPDYNSPNLKGAGSGGYRTDGAQGFNSGGAGGKSYGVADLSVLYLGSGGGGEGCDNGGAGGDGGNGGGIVFITVNTINFSGQINSAGGPGNGNRPAGGSGGSIRIDGSSINLNTISVSGGSGAGTPAVGAPGRIAVYYSDSFSGSFTPNYLKNTGLGLEDSIFTSSFEGGMWGAFDVIDGGNLSTSAQSVYWGQAGLSALINDNNDLYVQDDTPNAEPHYRARFYLNPNNVTMASGDMLDLFTGYSGATAVFRLQMQKSSGIYQVRIGARNDSGTWVDSAWYNLATGWNAVEINYLPGHLTGQMSLSIGGTVKQTLTTLDNDASTIDSVRLGAQGVDSGTRGTLYLDDFDSRRYSAIGLLPPPGSQNPVPTPEPGFSNAAYAYDSERAHAVTSVDRGAATDTYAYDQNGNMSCRVEAGNTYNQVYNAENRLYLAQLMKTGISCPSANTVAPANDVTASWTFTYDGDGTRVKQIYTTYVEPFVSITTYYFFGGAYEVRSDDTTIKYYSFGGQTIMRDEGGLKYFLTDHLGSVVAVTDSTGALLSQTRYLPFGLPRSDVGAITETDYGYTGQRNLDAQNTQYELGLMDYKARFYSPYLNRFTQPDTIIPGAGNPQAWNRYSYVLNRPTISADPSGHRNARACEMRGVCPEYRIWNRYHRDDEGDQSTLPWLPPVENPTIVGGDNYGDVNGWKPVDHDQDPTTPPKQEPSHWHWAVDLNPPEGTPAVASGVGVVHVSDACHEDNYDCVSLANHDDVDPTTIFTNGGYGNVVIIEYPYGSLPLEGRKLIEHGQSILAIYAHLLEPSPLRIGELVTPGDFIGIVGSSGNSTGLHLHLETRAADPGEYGFGSLVDGFDYSSLWYMLWNGNLPSINPHMLFDIGE